MKISNVIKELNDALKKYGDIPVCMTIVGKHDCINIEHVYADEENVVLYDYQNIVYNNLNNAEL